MFVGDPTLTVLPFLDQLVRVANQSHMSEATLLWVAEDFMRSPVKESFRSQHLSSWPAAIHWLLVTYAPGTAIETAVRLLQTAAQGSTETVRQYGDRIQIDAAALGSLVSPAELKSLFSQGLRDPVRSLFAAHQPSSELEDVIPLSVLIARAELLESGSRAATQFQPRYSVRPGASRPSVLLTPSEEEPVSPSGVVEVLAPEDRMRRESPAGWTCFVCCKTGHGWLDCPWLKDVPMQEKEETVIRRRRYLEQVQSSHAVRRPWSPSYFRGSHAANQAVVPAGVAERDPSPNALPKNAPASPRS
jgi:hypothetical protein